MIKSSQNGKDLAKLKRQVLDLERKKRELEEAVQYALSIIEKKKKE